jgi:hypothetical protein
MAGSKTDYLENAVLNYWLGKSFTSTAPATVYVRLYNSTINDTVTAATDRCAGANYADVAVTNSSANWTNATSGSKQNKTVVTFTTAASTGWGTINAFAILATNSTSSGNVLYWGDLTTPQVVAAGNTVRFSTAAIVITEA